MQAFPSKGSWHIGKHHLNSTVKDQIIMVFEGCSLDPNLHSHMMMSHFWWKQLSCHFPHPTLPQVHTNSLCKPCAYQLCHKLNNWLINSSMSSLNIQSLPLRDSALGFNKSSSSSKSSSSTSSMSSSTRLLESDQTAGFPNESLDEAPISKAGLSAEKYWELSVLPLMLTNPASLRLDWVLSALQSSLSLPMIFPFGFKILTNSEKSSKVCSRGWGSNRLESTTSKPDIGWLADKTHRKFN